MNIICKGRVNVAVPGTPVALSADPTLKAAKLFFEVIPGLTGKTYVGVAGMTKGTYAGVARVLSPNPTSGVSETFYIESQDGRNQLYLSEYMIDADVAGEGLLITYWTE